MRALSIVGAGGLFICAVVILWRAGLPAAPDFFVRLPADERIEAPVAGGLVPAFEGQTLDGQHLRVNADMGHPLIINFWATWCEPCIREMPLLETAYQAGVPVVGVNAGDEAPEHVYAWLREHAIQFPVVLDDAARSIEAQYRVQGLPTTLFVDAQGVVRQVHRGALTLEDLAEALRLLENTS
ncbi:MAG: TlpA family protein disulfide reductase [Anaerolineales bacterium]